MHPRILSAIVAGGVVALSGCSLVERLTPYKIDVRQGNDVTPEMVAQLKKGMTKDQVRFVLGTPLVTDVFHPDRWDYVYRFQPGRGDVTERRLTVFFKDEMLERVIGDIDPADPAEVKEKSRVIEISPAKAK